VTPGGRARVLIADDDSRLLQLLHDFLSGQGYEVAALATGIQVLDTLPAFQPDVIVVDMEMPGLSGPEVLAAVRRAGLTVPVILISGHQIIARDGLSSRSSESHSIFGGWPTSSRPPWIMGGRSMANDRRLEPSTESGENLVLPVVPQDVGHPGGKPHGSPPRQRLGAALPHLAGFQPSTTGRSWVSAEALIDAHLPAAAHSRHEHDTHPTSECTSSSTLPATATVPGPIRVVDSP